MSARLTQSTSHDRYALAGCFALFVIKPKDSATQISPPAEVLNPQHRTSVSGGLASEGGYLLSGAFPQPCPPDFVLRALIPKASCEQH